MKEKKVNLVGIGGEQPYYKYTCDDGSEITNDHLLEEQFIFYSDVNIGNSEIIFFTDLILNELNEDKFDEKEWQRTQKREEALARLNEKKLLEKKWEEVHCSKMSMYRTSEYTSNFEYMCENDLKIIVNKPDFATIKKDNVYPRLRKPDFCEKFNSENETQGEIYSLNCKEW